MIRNNIAVHMTMKDKVIVMSHELILCNLTTNPVYVNKVQLIYEIVLYNCKVAVVFITVYKNPE